MNAITKPSNQNAPQWIVIERTNGKLTIRGNTFREVIQNAGLELLRLAGEEEESGE